MNAQEWVKKAVILLPSRYDRKALGQELAAHIEDHKAALLAAGCPPEEAEEQAVAAMGDPKETAEALREAVASWMNWVIVLLQLTALVLAVFVGIRLYALFQEKISQASSIDSQIPKIFSLSEIPGELKNGSCQETAETAGHTVSVYWAKMSQDGTVMVLLKVEGPAEKYGTSEFINLLTLQTPDGKEPYIFRRNTGRSGGSTYIGLTVINRIDPETPWVEIAFEYGTEPFCLRVVFEEAKP
ncbi:MAG: hypothetical protein J5496_03400 [Lachnospiraceae bacterium]|nr:hypothetical protein [Lachnospiraceae bacterium]